MTKQKDRCFWCESEEAPPCSNCHLSSCDLHWELHRDKDSFACFPIRVDSHKQAVLVDFPSAVAPVHSSAPICLECYCLLSPHDWIQCPSCGFPLCSQECVGGKNHEKECFAFIRAGVKVDIDVAADNPAREYKCLMLLRLLMADKEELERVNLLTHHADKLTKDEEAVYLDGVIDMLQQILGNNWTT